MGSFVRANSYLSMRSDFTRVHLQSVSLSPLCMLTAGRGVWRVQEGISVWNLKQESADLLSLCLLWGKLIGTPEGGSQSSQLVRKAVSRSEPHSLLFTLMVAGLMGSCGSLAATAWPQKIIPHLYIISSGKSKIQDPNYGFFCLLLLFETTVLHCSPG